ncbi:MAG: LamG domain-containing protein [Candidatus Omnitrophota bacterium]|nr:LamG domain-containing protein [Candidatus Omnitrophota bacterium]
MEGRRCQSLKRKAVVKIAPWFVSICVLTIVIGASVWIIAKKASQDKAKLIKATWKMKDKKRSEIMSPTAIDQGITFYGNAHFDMTQRKVGESSLLLGGSGDYITVPNSDDWYWDGHFTVECWIKLKKSGDKVYNTIFDQYNDGSNYHQFREINGELYYNKVGGKPITVITSETGITTNTWYHVALVRSGVSWYIFVNGVKKAAGIDNTPLVKYTSAFNIGGNAVIGQYFNGWIDEFKVFKGTAVWTEEFTPAGQGFLSFFKTTSDE